MQYLALLSGGKDSCYNLVHCAQNGHQLVAAASLGPEPGKEEIDSYLYQTVGQDAIELVAQALDVPLYRRVITGDAVEQGSEYGGRNPASSGVAGDETEDLYELLATVKEHHPDVTGVSVGAILSNYQRVRVEHVCRRLDLTPLTFLWQRDQGGLLSEMINSGMEAILIKVAGIGLKTSHLGKSLAQMKPTLFKLNALYGSHICGEGGEYETLTLDCPLFKRRIRITETETVIHSDNDFATVAFLRIKSAELESKTMTPLSAAKPPLLDKEHEALRISIANVDNIPVPHSEAASPTSSDFPKPSIQLSRSIRKGLWAAVSNVQIARTVTPISVEEEVVQCFSILTHCLAAHNLQLTHIAIINIFISSMELFLRVNAVYAKFFGVSPPARACVGVDLPDGIHVRLDCIAFSDPIPGDRKSLHVQGLSYWAPANIGPYSQAIAVGERVFVSGQIGLIPSFMSIPSPRSLPLEIALASQHATRVVDALKENSGGGWDGHTQLSIYWLIHCSDIKPIKTGCCANKTITPSPTLILVVKELPKGALVEKQVIIHTGRCQIVDEDDGERSTIKARPIYEEGDNALDNERFIHWEASRFAEDGAACAVVFVKGDFTHSIQDFKCATSGVTLILESALSIRLFYTHTSSNATFMEKLASVSYGDQDAPPITPIPCYAISSRDRSDWDLALCIITSSVP